MIADAVAVEEQQADEAYRILLAHTEECRHCRAGEECDDERRLSRAWRTLRSAAAHSTPHSGAS